MTALLVSIVLAAVPILAGSFTKPVHANGTRGFHFVSLAAKGGSPPTEIVAIDGKGEFDVADGEVEGGGSFTHFDNTTPVPKTVIAFGTWNVVSLVSYHEVGTAASFASGTLVVKIHLVRADGTVVPAMLTVNCNLGFAGLSTGSEEGITIVVGGTTFTPFAGLTVFDVLQQNSQD